MLQFLREKTTGWIAIAILILLSIPFAFFGMEQYLFQRNATWVATVEAPPTWWRGAPSWWPAKMLWQREEITADDFRIAFDEARRQAREQQGELFDPRAFESAENKREVLERLVDQRMLALDAARGGLVVSNAQVRKVVLAQPEFQVDGRFDPQRYQMALAAGNPPRTPVQYDEFLRDRMQETLLPFALLESAFVTDSELDRLLRLSGESRDVSFFVLQPVADEAPVDDAEAKAWYDAHPADYRVPEMVDVEYVEFDASQVAATAPPSESALRAQYEQNKSRYGAASERLVSHILVEVDASADAAAQQAAEAEARQLVEQARAPGADFGALAQASSDDAGSASAGGDLGWIGQDGSMVKPFEDAVFEAEPGSIVGPVRTDFGWHVIHVRESKQGSVQPFEEVREQLAEELARNDRERAYSDALTRMMDEVYKNPTSLEAAARAGGVSVKTLAGLPREGSADAGVVGSHPLVLREAFSEVLIQDGTVSDPIEVGPEHNVLLRVSRHVPASTRPLEQVREEVAAAVRADRARKALEADAEALLAEVKGGKTLDAVATARGLEAIDIPSLPRNVPMPDMEASKALFSVPAPSEGEVSPGRTRLADGGAMVFVVTRVTPGDPATASEEERNTLRGQIAQVNALGEIEALRKALRQRYRISIEESRL
ncbi:MAG: peptidyl-prolyl cis-trans isomerase [Pseudoxanthomonas suwonensis]|nr:peptidyl-prolyl cis-trans isomerase [Pseudoxanthomonas suwonensis]